MLRGSAGLAEVISSAANWSADRLTPLLMQGVLRTLSVATRVDPALRGQLQGTHPLGQPWSWRATIAFTTVDGRHQCHSRFADGAMRLGPRAPEDADVTVTFAGLPQMRAFFLPGSDPLNLLLDGGVRITGNLTHLTKFSHLISVLQLRGKPREPTATAVRYRSPGRWQEMAPPPTGQQLLRGDNDEATWLEDLALSGYSLDDFPRIKRQLHHHRTTQPAICPERARLLTEFVVSEQMRGRSATAALRQARALRHILTNKAPIIGDDDLLAGTTTSRSIGVVLYPETFGTTIWPELLTVGARPMNPYRVDEEVARELNEEIFPFWIEDNIREHTKRRDGAPLSLRLDERFRLYFQWKSYAVSHTVADLPTVLQKGLRALSTEARQRRLESLDQDKRDFYRALEVSLEAVTSYASRLADEARRQLELLDEGDEARRLELLEIARICDKVPAEPAESFAEAVQAIWIVFLCLHQENVNAGLSLGRLDRWLEPYLQRDLAKCQSDAGRETTLERALELICSLMLKLTDHVPLVPDLGNRLFGGSSSDQVITLGGVDDDGDTAVCDATWLWLKATEMLALRDPNMNARFAPGVNSEAYLRRLCEVNLITGATPSLHNDAAMIPALVALGFPERDARDWSATGCVEPTICGRHFGHTGCLMFNAVAALEMALHNGRHPTMGEERIGPSTGSPDGFERFEELFQAFERQLRWLLDQAVDANNRLGRSHQQLKPTPLLSALFQGPMESGRDVIDGGARYNSTGVAIVGLPDVVDSLTAIELMIYQRERLDWPGLLGALETDFEGEEALLAELLTRAPKFGQDDPQSTRLAQRIIDLIYDHLGEKEHYRGGRYLPGYWSMSNHVAFGALSGALPSGRMTGKAFAPGLTPTPNCWAPLTEQIRAVSRLDTVKMPNNLAFNVKVVPGGDDDRAKVVDRMAAYVGAYFELGGMQLQFNVVSTATLREAMAHPEQYRDLLVRISGYNAYFVDLNRATQEELIERTAHNLGR